MFITVVYRTELTIKIFNNSYIISMYNNMISTNSCKKIIQNLSVEISEAINEMTFETKTVSMQSKEKGSSHK